MSTPLERARAIVDAFVPQDKPGSHLVYAYLGKATYDATQYEFIDGLCLAGKRIWHLDESQTDCVAYVGEGISGRIGVPRSHPFVPINSECRIKLYEGASKADAQELERLLIAELGCILDDDRSDGCLSNIKYYVGGPCCCSFLEAVAYKIARGAQKGSAACAVDVIAMTEDRTIVSRDSASGLARELGVSHGYIIGCCRRQKRGIWQSSEQRALYFCYAQDYLTYKIKPMSTKQSNKERILIVVRLDGSDIFSGTASEVAAYAPEIKHTFALHKVAQGKRKSTYGFIARYADEISDVPIAAAFPALNTFF